MGDECRAAGGTAVGAFLDFGKTFGMRDGGGMDDGGFLNTCIVSLAFSKAVVASRKDGRKTSSSFSSIMKTDLFKVRQTCFGTISTMME
jgi:hypothetical protein